MANVMKEDDEKQEEFVAVEEPIEEDEDESPSDNIEFTGEDDDEDERTASSEDEDDDEREAIRERRRKEKQERKQRRDEAIKRDKLELDFLRKRNDDLERRVTAQEERSYKGDLSQIDQAIQQAAKEAEMADKVIAKAVEAGNGADVTQAMKYRDQALQRINQLQAHKQQAQSRPVQQPKIDDMTMHYAQEFIKENPWYDSQGRNEDSAVVMAIDQSLARDGYDPRTEEYWAELRSRAAKRLPERFAAPKQARKARGGPAVGSGKEHAPTSTRKEVYISPERKAALIEAGVWDDPVLRQKYVKRYAEYDRANRS